MTPDIHTLTGAYALNALTDDERQEFDAHLALCPSCAQELRELAETAARMGSTCATIPPPGLKTQVMTAARIIRQLPPRLEDINSTPRRGRRARARHSLLAVAAAVILAVASLAVMTVDAERRADRTQALTNAVASVVSAPDARMVAGATGPRGSGRVVVSRLRDKAVFVAAGMTPAPAAKTYQAWLIGPSGTHSAGLLDVGNTGSTGPLVAAGLGSATTLGLTIEPAGGSTQPSTPPLLLLPLPR